jgi:hypothetical protein
LYYSLNIIRKMKSRRIRWGGHVACMGAEECIQDFGGNARKEETARKT